VVGIIVFLLFFGSFVARLLGVWGLLSRVRNFFSPVAEWRRRHGLRWLDLTILLLFLTIILLRHFGARHVIVEGAKCLTSRFGAPALSKDALAEEVFKHGSIGTEEIPESIWRALPHVCRADLPGGYESLGLIWEKPQEADSLPIGFSRKTGITYSSLGVNCALCHTAVYRVKEGGERHIVLGGPGHQMDVQGYLKFLVKCAEDSNRFTAATIIAALQDQGASIPWWKKPLYYPFVMLIRWGILEQGEQFHFQEKQPVWGPGRFDAINGGKSRLFHLPYDGTIGVADIPSAWRLIPSHSRHWDGDTVSLTEAIRGEAISTGTPHGRFQRFLNSTYKQVNKNVDTIEKYLRNLPAPPYPGDINKEQAMRGKLVFQERCADCHAPSKEGNPTRLGRVIPLEEIGTDPYRFHARTRTDIEKKNELRRGSDWRFSNFRKSSGYVAVSLEGVWLRAPYLHNGSVPTLCDLLEPPEKRPTTFYRGNEVLDLEKVGFVSDQAPENKQPFDTRMVGNGNGGHLFGVDLPEEQKKELLEYLKTLGDRRWEEQENQTREKSTNCGKASNP
jgi:hypothetical protein